MEWVSYHALFVGKLGLIIIFLSATAGWRPWFWRLVSIRSWIAVNLGWKF